MPLHRHGTDKSIVMWLREQGAGAESLSAQWSGQQQTSRLSLLLLREGSDQRAQPSLEQLA